MSEYQEHQEVEANQIPQEPETSEALSEEDSEALSEEALESVAGGISSYGPCRSGSFDPHKYWPFRKNSKKG